MNTINKEKFKEKYNPEFIDNICEIFEKYINFLNENHPRELYRQNWAIPFFRQFGKMEKIYDHFYHRNIDEIDNELISHMRNTLYSPNYSVLDFVLENYETFSKCTFLDFACGTGILSVYLDKLNIFCYNYDTNTEIGLKKENETDDFSEFTFTYFYNKLTGKKLDVVSDKKIESYDCLVCCGYYLEHSFINDKIKYIFLDTRYNNFNNPNFKLIASYPNSLNVYKKNGI